MQCHIRERNTFEQHVFDAPIVRKPSCAPDLDTAHCVVVGHQIDLTVVFEYEGIRQVMLAGENDLRLQRAGRPVFFTERYPRDFAESSTISKFLEEQMAIVSISD